MVIRMRNPTAVLALLAAAACIGEPDVVGPPDPTELTYADELDIDFARMTQTTSGLWYEDLQVGEGEMPIAGDSVFVLYSGWLHNGILFDSVTDPDDALGFHFLIDAVIPGFVEGLQSMREGGIRKLVIPPHLGYGAQPRQGVPSNSTLVFQVNLLDVRRP